MRHLIRITIICALLTQISHASHVFYSISEKTTFDYIMSWLFALSLETSIFIFTMFGQMRVAIFFGVISWLINLLTYWFPLGFTQQFVAMNIISLIIPITIYFYSELIKGEKPEKVEKRSYIRRKPIKVQKSNN